MSDRELVIKRPECIELVVKIPEWVYERAQDMPSVWTDPVWSGIKNGTPLPKGHWYIDERPESDREVICSNCEQPVFKYHKLDFDYRPKYCPNCGADMRGEEK